MDYNDIRDTDIWSLYEKGRNYHRLKGIYTDTDLCYDMFYGNQWRGAKLGGEEPIVINFLKPIVKYKLAIIHDNQYSVVYNSENYENRELRKVAERYCDMLNGYAARVWEKDRMDKKGRELTKDAAICGEGVMYVDFDKETMMPVNQLVNKADIYYGNENDDEIQDQPYILIRKRLAQSVAIDLALSLGMSSEDIPYIVGDNEVFEQSGEEAKEEVDDNVTVVYKLYKRDGTVHFSVATRYVDIVEDEDLGIKLYPVAHFNWEVKKGFSRGDGEIKSLIPNQIEVNKVAMRRALTVKDQSFPMRIVDITKIENPSDLDNVGGTIKTNTSVDDVGKIIGSIQPAQMSPDVVKLQEDLINITRDLAGAGDTATGSVDPENASGRAILAAQQAQRAPVTEYKDGYKDTIEDLARIWLEYLIVHAVDGAQLEEEFVNEEGKDDVRLINVPQSLLEQLQASVKIDITPKSAYDKFAREQTLENFLTGGFFNPAKIPETKAYAKALSDDSTSPKLEILEVCEEVEETQRRIAALQSQAQIMHQKAVNFLDSDPAQQSEQIRTAETAATVSNIMRNQEAKMMQEMAEKQ